jgi:outer membrane protein assembly factor BamB
VAAVFSMTVVVLMAVTLARLDRAGPLDADTAEKRFSALREGDADAGLQEDVRGLDLLARRAFFSAKSFLFTGTWLLLAGVAACFGAWKLRFSLLAKLPVPVAGSGDGPPPTWGPAQTAVAGLGVLLVAASLVVALLLPEDPRPVPRPILPVKELDEPVEPIRALPAGPTTEEILKSWPCFRGPFGLAVAHGQDPPVEWDGHSGRNILWKVAVPAPGFSSPVIWGDRLLITGGDSKVREVFCFSRSDGSLVWRKAASLPAGVKPPRVTDDTGYAAPTPATDGRVVCAVFATGNVLCLDLEGREIWTRHLLVPENPYGHGSSPLIWRDLLILQFDHGGGGRILALELATGKTAWQTERDVEVCWCTPILAEIEGKTRLFTNGNPIAAAYDPETGKELWQTECMMGEVATSPTFDRGLVFMGNENATLVAIDAAGGEILWEGDLDLPDVSSPLASGGRLYVPSGGGILTCYDARTGEEKWLKEFSEGFWSSPILAGGRIYLLDYKGVMLIFADQEGFQSLGAPELGEGVTTTPAFAEDRIYVRGNKHLFCIGSAEEK